jgi:predicted heme/steroid binding protein
MKVFNALELSRFNGKGMPSYIVYMGKVYDVSDSVLWREGRHQALHEAGVDLTEALSQAPHGDELLKDFPVVGLYSASKK